MLTPDQSKVVIGGSFLTLNGQPAYGLGAVSAADGSSVPWAANQYIQDYTPAGATQGHGASIESLKDRWSADLRQRLLLLLRQL